MAINGLNIVLDITIVNIAFPKLTKIFQTTPEVVLWVSVVYSLITMGLMPVLGRIGDQYGRRKVFLLGFFLFTVGLGLCAVSQSITQLILSRIVQGIGGAMNMALGFAIVTDAFPANERGKALGVMSSVFAVGPLLGFSIGGLVLDSIGWRAIFWARLPISIIGLMMAWAFLSENKTPNNTNGIDYTGAFTLFGGMTGMILFFNLGGRFGFGSFWVILLGIIAVVLFYFFLRQEWKTPYPLVDLCIFKVKRFAIGSLNLSAYGLAQAIQMFIFPFYLIDGLGQSAAQAGLLLSISPLMMIVGAPLAGWISDIFGTKRPCFVGLIIFSVGLFLFSRLDVSTDRNTLIIYLIIMMAGGTLFNTSNTSLLMGAAPKAQLGSIGALITTIRQTGQATGIALAGLVFALRQSHHAEYLATRYANPGIVKRLSLVSGFTDTMFFAMLLTVITVAAVTLVLDRRLEP